MITIEGKEIAVQAAAEEVLWEFIRAFEAVHDFTVYGCSCNNKGDHDSECEIDLFITFFVKWLRTGEV